MRIFADPDRGVVVIQFNERAPFLHVQDGSVLDLSTSYQEPNRDIPELHFPGRCPEDWD